MKNCFFFRRYAAFAYILSNAPGNLLYVLGEISGETIFIDGTKIEACANKYTFVWKKAVTRNQGKLLIKIAGLLAECEQLYGIRIIHGDTVKMKHVKRLRKKLYALKQEENIEFVHGIGKRKSALQKSIETLEGWTFQRECVSRMEQNECYGTVQKWHGQELAFLLKDT